jgi:hypothetical protein
MGKIHAGPLPGKECGFMLDFGATNPFAGGLMSKEAAAATLTQIYYDKVNAQVSRRKPTDKIGVEAVEEIGEVYAAFLARLSGTGQQGGTAPAAPKA